MPKLQWKINTLPQASPEEKKELVSFLSEEEMEKAIKFHQSFPMYEPTPLVELKDLAKKIGVKDIYLKDESYRFGLNAFKVMGGSYAMAKYMAEELDMKVEDLPYEKLISPEIKEKLGDVCFVTATDGNHGRGVAWTAQQLQQKSRVFMPMGSSQIRFDAIKAHGSEVTIEDANYDECVRMADEYVKNYDGKAVVVQDTAWEGYEKIPAWIMQGYGTLALETMQQLEKAGVEMPSHVFIQAGVGSFAGAVQGFFAAKFGEKGPVVSIVESDLADCLYQGAVANDGDLRTVGGEMQTLMAGLACGEPNTTGWEILKNNSTCFISSPDHVAANGMRILAAPTGEDTRVTSGESGAVTTGIVYEIMTNDALSELRKAIQLTEDSTVLVFSTEGDTDPEIYEDVVWRGRNSKL